MSDARDDLYLVAALLADLDRVLNPLAPDEVGDVTAAPVMPPPLPPVAPRGAPPRSPGPGAPPRRMLGAPAAAPVARSKPTAALPASVLPRSTPLAHAETNAELARVQREAAATVRGPEPAPPAARAREQAERRARERVQVVTPAESREQAAQPAPARAPVRGEPRPRKAPGQPELPRSRASAPHPLPPRVRSAPPDEPARTDERARPIVHAEHAPPPPRVRSREATQARRAARGPIVSRAGEPRRGRAVGDHAPTTRGHVTPRARMAAVLFDATVPPRAPPLPPALPQPRRWTDGEDGPILDAPPAPDAAIDAVDSPTGFDEDDDELVVARGVVPAKFLLRGGRVRVVADVVAIARAGRRFARLARLRGRRL